jgi:hypothetical protein
VLVLDRGLRQARAADRIYQGHMQTGRLQLLRGGAGRCWTPTWSSARSRARRQGADAGQQRPGVAHEAGARCSSTSPSTRVAVSRTPVPPPREPTFRVHGSVFYCVANMPGAVPTHHGPYALTNVTLPYVMARPTRAPSRPSGRPGARARRQRVRRQWCCPRSRRRTGDRRRPEEVLLSADRHAGRPDAERWSAATSTTSPSSGAGRQHHPSYRRDPPLHRVPRRRRVRGLARWPSDVAGSSTASGRGKSEHPPLSATSAAAAVVASAVGCTGSPCSTGLVPGDVAARCAAGPGAAAAQGGAGGVGGGAHRGRGRTEGPRGLRDRALLECSTAPARGSPRPWAWPSTDLDRGQSVVRLAGKGGKERDRPGRQHTRAAPSRSTSVGRARAGCGMAGRPVRGGPCCSSTPRGGPLSRQSAWTILRAAAARARSRGGLAAHAAALLRHPPARRRRRRPRSCRSCSATRR